MTDQLLYTHPDSIVKCNLTSYQTDVAIRYG